MQVLTLDVKMIHKHLLLSYGGEVRNQGWPKNPK